MRNDGRNRKTPAADDAIEREVRLSADASARFLDLVQTPTTDLTGRTYLDRMRERAVRARKARSG